MTKIMEDLINDLEMESLPDFGMVRYRTECGGPLCIGGWACFRTSPSVWEDRGMDNVVAARGLGIDYGTAMKLFEPRVKSLGSGYLLDEQGPWSGVANNPYDATQKQAAQALRNAWRISEELRGR